MQIATYLAALFLVAGFITLLGLRLKTARQEAALYAVLLITVYTLAVLPHIQAYGGGFGSGFGVALVGLLVAIVSGVIAIVLAGMRPRRPRRAFLFRLAAIPLLMIGPEMVSWKLGALATNEGRGYSARVRKLMPLDRLQDWAVKGLTASPHPALPEDMALVFKRCFLSEPRIHWGDGDVTLSVYHSGMVIGARDYTLHEAPFYLEAIRPGVYVYVTEK